MREPEKPRQLPLDLAHAPGLSREDLVVSPANRAAVELVERWPDWPSAAVVLAGPPGSGKSHLAAIWRERSGAVAFEAGKIAAGTAGAGQTLAFLINDADAPGLDETGLFHLMNHVRQNGGHLLLTARRFAPAWGVRLPDLASRLKAAPTVEIAEPDDLLLAGVITKLFADRQVAVDASVVQFLVRRIERSLATASDVVDRLDRAALERQGPVTRALAAQVVSALDSGQAEMDL